MAQMEGASSLHSANVSLQISHNSLYDLISSVFSLPTAELDSALAAELYWEVIWNLTLHLPFLGLFQQLGPHDAPHPEALLKHRHVECVIVEE